MINVIGLGYIGLPTALMLAANGNEVIGTDLKHSLIETLNEKTLPFEERGLEMLYDRALKNNIKFTTEYQVAEYYIVAVPTPYDEVSKKIDSRYVVMAIEQIFQVCMKNSIIIIESTISPKTIDTYVRPVLEEYNKNKDANVKIAHAPERIIPGNMVYELENNSRTVGCDEIEVGEKVKNIYKSFCKGDIIITDIKIAEMTKVIENTYRDINIAFANELAKICHFSDMDVYEVIRIANKHPRVNILNPGPGVGGHCISVDPWFLVGDYPELTKLIYTARTVNDSMPEYVLARVSEIMRENNIVDMKRVGFYGITYKENVDDVRESPTLQLVECMNKHMVFDIKCYDPYVKKKIIDGQLMDFEEFLQDIDFMVVMVGHEHIKEYQHKLSSKIVLDTRNVLTIGNVHKL